MSVLVISAHTDDIELAAGGTISGLTNVYGYCPTLHHDYGQGYNTANECRCAWGVLNINMVDGVKTDHHARSIDRQQLLDDLIKLKNQIKPRLVITHGSKDTHQSHQVVYNESLRAFKNCSLLGFIHPWNGQNGIEERYFIKIRQYHVTKKMQALSCYVSQSEKWYFDQDYQISLLRNKGKIVMSEFAESYELIRWIQ